MNKKDIIECLDLKINIHAQSTYIRDAFRKLARDSEVHWVDPEDKKNWMDAPLILSRTSFRGIISVEINPYFMPHLECLTRDKSFITILSTDIYRFNSKYSFALFYELRLHYDARQAVNNRFYTTKQLKEIFGLKKNDFLRKNGKFDRSGFERVTLNVAAKEINQGKMMQILSAAMKGDSDHIRFFTKIYDHGKVLGYEFRYFVRTSFHE